VSAWHVVSWRMGMDGSVRESRDMTKGVLPTSDKPTVSLLLTPVASRNLLLLQSLPDSIPYRPANVRRRKDEHCVGAAARGLGERLSRLPRRVPSDVGPTLRVRSALPTRAGDRDRPAQRASLPPRAPVALARQKC